MKKIVIYSIVAFAMVLAPEAFAQGPGRGPGQGPGMGMDHGGMRHALKKHVYPIEMVRRHAEELNLTDAQIEKLRKVVTDVNAEMEQLKWDLSAQTRALVKLVEGGATKDDIYAQMDRVFKYENKIKKKHLGLMIVIRDVLTKKQKKYLDDIKEERFNRGNFKKGKSKKGNSKEGRRGKKNKGKRPFHSGPNQPF
jgi:Spy/CpxP family protein refolding chaperone